MVAELVTPFPEVPVYVAGAVETIFPNAAVVAEDAGPSPCAEADEDAALFAVAVVVALAAAVPPNELALFADGVAVVATVEVDSTKPSASLNTLSSHVVCFSFGTLFSAMRSSTLFVTTAVLGVGAVFCWAAGAVALTGAVLAAAATGFVSAGAFSAGFTSAGASFCTGCRCAGSSCFTGTASPSWI